MKRIALILVGGLVLLAVALPASGGLGHASKTPLQKAEACLRAAIHKEAVAVRYINEGKLSNSAVDGVIAAAIGDLKCTNTQTERAYAADDISQSLSGAIHVNLREAEDHDASVKYDANKRDRLRALELAELHKSGALKYLEEATAPPSPPPTTTTAPASFTIALAHVFGAGSSSSNACETVTVTETGITMTPSGTLNLTGPGGFDMTNPLTFTPGPGGGVFTAPSTFLLNSFGTYTERAAITVGGMTDPQTGTWTIDSSNDQTSGGCSPP